MANQAQNQALLVQEVQAQEQPNNVAPLDEVQSSDAQAKEVQLSNAQAKEVQSSDAQAKEVQSSDAQAKEVQSSVNELLPVSNAKSFAQEFLNMMHTQAKERAEAAQTKEEK